MRKTNRRFTLLGLTVLMSVLSMVSLHVRPAYALFCLPYCNDWQYNGDCCFASGRSYNRLVRQCTDGAGNYCTEYTCSTVSPCAI
ncbi:MAG: hypothetical protein ACJ76N_22170 [Thermoanaerobaculia bacterium]